MIGDLEASVRRHSSRLFVLAATIIVIAASIQPALAQRLEPITYTVRVAAPDTHYVEVEAAVPTGGRASIEMMMPAWSPGYYRIEDYAARVDEVKARTSDGKPLPVEKTTKNRWRIQTGTDDQESLFGAMTGDQPSMQSGLSGIAAVIIRAGKMFEKPLR